MLLMAIPPLLGFDVVTAAKAAGITATVVLLLVTFRFVRALDGLTGWARDLPACAAVVWMSVFLPISMHAAAGMETALFTCLLTAYFAALTRLVAAPTVRRMYGVAALGLAISITRPEGHLALLIGALTAGVMLPATLRRSWLRALLLLYVLPTAINTGWRLIYYGHLLPMPFYVKVVAQSALAGRSEVVGFLRALAIGVGPFALLGAVRGPRSLRPALLAAASLVIFFLFPRHIMSFDWRYLVPISPLVFVLAATGLGVLQRRLQQGVRGPRAWSSASAGWLVVSVIGVAWPLVYFGRDVGSRIEAKQGIAKSFAKYVELGRVLRAVGQVREQPRLAIGDAGAIPYYSGWHTIDLVGLNDAVIARRGTPDPSYVLGERPDLIVVNSASVAEFVERLPGMQLLYSSAQSAGFTVVQRIGVRWDYYLWILSKSGSPIAQRFDELNPAGTNLLQIACQRCGTMHLLQLELPGEPLEAGYQPFPASGTLTCRQCGLLIVLDDVRRQLEARRARAMDPRRPQYAPR
jgi:hypothetical protein